MYEKFTDNEVADLIRALPAHFVDLSVTAASVLRISGPTQTYLAGASLTAGMPVYVSDTTTTPNTVAKCLNDSAAHAAFAGLTLHAAGTGQPITIATPGCVVAIGATVVLGAMYVISANAGAVAPDSDLATGYFVTDIGRAITTARIQITGTQWGIAHA